MILFEIIAERAQKIRDFILLPWLEKKKRIRHFWDKYGRLYILLFILAIVIAVINLYMETQIINRAYSQISQLGGNNTKKPPDTKNLTSKQNSNSSTEPTATNNQAIINQARSQTNHGQRSNTINISTDVLIEKNTEKNSKDRISEIKERRKEKQQQRSSQSSVKDSLSSLGNNLTSGVSEGTGRALSVLGTFFSAILGLLLFCCAPVVIFYMWMKKLIMPLFPTPRTNNY